MLKTPELAMPRTRKVTTVCNGRREVWTDYEEAKAYFLELMMSTDGVAHERAECVYIQLLHGLDECSDEDEKRKRSVALWKRYVLYIIYVLLLLLLYKQLLKVNKTIIRFLNRNMTKYYLFYCHIPLW